MRVVVVLLWWFACGPANLFAQWRVGLDVTNEWLFGASGPGPAAVAGSPSFRPYEPIWWGLRVEGPGNGIRPVLTLRAGAPDLALEGEEATVIEHFGVTDVLGAIPEVAFPIARIQEGVRLLASAGVVVERWSFEGQEARLRAGPTGGIELAVSLGGRLEGAIGASVGVLPESIFTVSDLPETLEPRSVWRRSLRGSLKVRL